LLCEANNVLRFRQDCRAFDKNSKPVEYGNGEKVNFLDLKEKSKFWQRLVGSYGAKARIWVNGQRSNSFWG
jgi:hypothetical protein